MSQEIPDRITVVENIYFQRRGEDPSQCGKNFELTLETKEQPYDRDLTINEEWKLLDLGWLKENTKLLWIFNKEGKFLATIPTKEEKEIVSKKVIEVFFYNRLQGDIRSFENIRAVNEIYPLTASRCCLSPSVDVYARSQSGPIKLTVVAFPR